MLSAVAKAFIAWKESVTDKDGLILVTERINTLLATPRERLVPADTVMPYQCAGPDVLNGIDLAFKLWLDGFNGFEEVLDTHGLVQTFALIGVLYGKEANVKSLLRLNRFLTEHLSNFTHIVVEIAEENMGKAKQQDKMLTGLSKGRETSAKRRKERSMEQTALLKRMAAEYWMEHPAAKSTVVARYLKPRFHNLAISTIEARLKGVKTATLSAMDTDIPK
ncbi:MAG: hypothetical protein O3C57_06360 [Verrucomicrobia bacterium]|nr:hypothetical protein [Verrucomicrobiota bacterium]